MKKVVFFMSCRHTRYKSEEIAPLFDPFHEHDDANFIYDVDDDIWAVNSIAHLLITEVDQSDI